MIAFSIHFLTIGINALRTSFQELFRLLHASSRDPRPSCVFDNVFIVLDSGLDCNWVFNIFHRFVVTEKNSILFEEGEKKVNASLQISAAQDRTKFREWAVQSTYSIKDLTL